MEIVNAAPMRSTRGKLSSRIHVENGPVDFVFTANTCCQPREFSFRPLDTDHGCIDYAERGLGSTPTRLDLDQVGDSVACRIPFAELEGIARSK